MIEHLDEPLEVWRGLLYGQRSMMTRLMADVKKQFGLTVPQFEALLLLSESARTSESSELAEPAGNVEVLDGLSATDLAAGLLYSSGSASHLISRLEELGFVARVSDERDSRKVLVRLTRAGSDVISQAARAHIEDLNREFVPLIDPAEVPVLLKFARGLAAHEGVSSQIQG